MRYGAVAAVGIVDICRDMGGQCRADPGVDLDLLESDQHRFEILAGRHRWRVSTLTDRPIAGQPHELPDSMLDTISRCVWTGQRAADITQSEADALFGRSTSGPRSMQK